MTLPGTASFVGRQETPYPIINVTIYSKDTERSWPQKLMELTPVFYGTSDFGYKDWNTEKFKTWNEAIAISGSAFGPLKTPIEVNYPDHIQSSTKLWDGGKSENLGAMALIRRGVKNIIIVDAEHDPAYIFDAYRNLKANLGRYGLKLSVREIDEHFAAKKFHSLEKSWVAGSVDDKNGQLVSNIYYIKAGLPNDIKPSMDQHAPKTGDGWEIRTKFRKALNASRKGGSRDWHCDEVDFSFNKFYQWAAHNAGSYRDYLNGENKKAKIIGGVGTQNMKINFPQYSTADQSFKNDQTWGFIGLGYLQGREFSK
ncbi:MAG: hypothetical protein Pars2KO_25430 [Parasphingorhabdus sp.]